MWNHGPEMIGRMATTGTPIPAFSGNEMADIFAALTKETPEKGKKVFLGVGNAENGEKLFTDKGCIKCHSIFGKGGECDEAYYPDLEPRRTDEATVQSGKTAVALFHGNRDE
jgi:mono/diheme cytochrome c family protein